MAEENIFHLDLKLENILIKYNEDKAFTIKLSGYACSNSKKVASNIRKSFNSFYHYYMPPEILKEDPYEYNYKIDLWSLGIIIYDLYFKEIPFKGGNEFALFHFIENFTQYYTIA